jgi:UDP-glucose 4-epimerase
VAGNGTGIGHDLSPFNLLPNLYRAVKENNNFSLFGNTFDTPDGSCIRDYVDVTLLAKAHVRTLVKLFNKENLSFAYNLGSGLGTSVLQIIEAVKKVTGVELNILIYPPRIGDPSKVTADISLAQKDLGWNHDMTTEQIVHSGWKAWNKS